MDGIKKARIQDKLKEEAAFATVIETHNKEIKRLMDKRRTCWLAHTISQTSDISNEIQVSGGVLWINANGVILNYMSHNIKILQKWREGNK